MVAAAAALAEHDDGVVEVSYGAVALPDEANAPETAFEVASQRLVARKQRQRRSASRQAHAVLLAVLSARRPELRDHVRDVSFRVLAVGRRLGIDEDDLDDVVRAAQLQDIGLLAVPEEVLESERRLSDEERRMIDEHTEAGERIIAAAPGLEAVARLVRSSGERYDGTGYPDGLRGEEIPLGSRVITACVAFAAMTAARPVPPARLHDRRARSRSCAPTRARTSIPPSSRRSPTTSKPIAEPRPLPRSALRDFANAIRAQTGPRLARGALRRRRHRRPAARTTSRLRHSARARRSTSCPSCPRAGSRTSTAGSGSRSGRPPGWRAEHRGASTLLRSPDHLVAVSISADRTLEAVEFPLDDYVERGGRGAAALQEAEGRDARGRSATSTRPRPSARRGSRTACASEMLFIALRRRGVVTYPLLVARNAEKKSGYYYDEALRMVRTLRGRPLG